MPCNVSNENEIAGTSGRLLHSTLQSLFRDVCESVCVRFIPLQPVRAVLHCHAGASHSSGLSRWGAQALGVWASGVAAYGLCSAGSELWCTGLAASQHVGSSRTRDRTGVPCIARQILNHWTTREAPIFLSMCMYHTYKIH